MGDNSESDSGLRNTLSEDESSSWITLHGTDSSEFSRELRQSRPPQDYNVGGEDDSSEKSATRSEQDSEVEVVDCDKEKKRKKQAKDNKNGKKRANSTKQSKKIVSQGQLDAAAETQEARKLVEARKKSGEKPAKKSRGNNSNVWNFFEKIDNFSRRCSECGTHIKQSGASTSSMRNHMISKHPNVWSESTVGEQPSIHKYTHVKKDWKLDGRMKAKYDRYLVRFVVGTNLSINAVDDPYLKKIVHPEYVVPGHSHFRDVLLKVTYDETKQTVKEVVTKCQYVGVQIDHTTASNVDPYANVCITFVDDSYKYVSISLGTYGYNEGHTSDQIFNSVEGENGVLRQWDLHHTRRVYTTDTCNTMSAAFKNSEWFGCFAHKLHLTVKRGLSVSEVTILLDKLHAITTYFHKSPKAMIDLKLNEEWLGFPELNPTSECITRWSSMIKSGKRLIEIRVPLGLSLVNANRVDLMLTLEDWSLLEEIVKELDFFEQTTTLIQKEGFTMNVVLPSIHAMKQKLSVDAADSDSEDPSVISKFRKAMLKYLESMYNEESTHNRLVTAAALDPRFFMKTKYSNNEATKILQDSVSDLWRYIQSKESQESQVSQSQIQGTPGQEQRNLSRFPPSLASTSNSTREPEPTPTHTNYLFLLGSAEDDWPHCETEVSLEQKIADEVSSYKICVLRETPTILKELRKDNSTWELSTWWHEHENRFPYLSTAVKAFLCVPASSANCERAFSSCTDLITKKRKRLTPETAEMILFLKDNSKYISDEPTSTN